MKKILTLIFIQKLTEEKKNENFDVMIIELYQFLIIIVMILGGIGSVFWKFANYFGKLWANKYLTDIKQQNEKELQSYKTKLDFILQKKTRYSKKQFDRYQALYLSILELKKKGEILWEKSSKVNYERFKVQLTATKNDIEEAFLFLEDDHYNRFSDIFREFNKYGEGNKAIIKGITDQNSDFNQTDFEKWIEENSFNRDKYNKLVEDIRKDLRNQLQGNFKDSL